MTVDDFDRNADSTATSVEINWRELALSPVGREEKAELVLARLGEIALKGLNRRIFEGRLMENIKRRLRAYGSFRVHQSDSRIWITPADEEAAAHLTQAMDVASSVFGIVSASKVTRYVKFQTIEEIASAVLDYAQAFLTDGLPQRFKVESRRGDKRLPFRSPELVRDMGALLLDYFPQLTVDVHKPDFVLQMELRDGLYIYHDKRAGLKGLPIGSSGKSMLLLSGGIDSPIAGYMMASRGVELEAVYFHTYPYTSDRAKEKVLDLGRILCDYIGRLRIHVVDFTDIQLEIRDKCPADMMTIVMRRMMMRIAEKLALSRHCLSLITGESLGQVASQTAEALAATDAVATLPVFRPLIGTDKDDTVHLARKIGTFETSILPYEDCCTVFVAKHPRTRPSLQQAEAAEKKLDIPALVQQGVDKSEVFLVK